MPSKAVVFVQEDHQLMLPIRCFVLRIFRTREENLPFPWMSNFSTVHRHHRNQRVNFTFVEVVVCRLELGIPAPEAGWRQCVK